MAFVGAAAMAISESARGVQKDNDFWSSATSREPSPSRASTVHVPKPRILGRNREDFTLIRALEPCGIPGTHTLADLKQEAE